MLNLGGVVGGLKILQNFTVRVMGVTQLGIDPPPWCSISGTIGQPVVSN